MKKILFSGLLLSLISLVLPSQQAKISIPFLKTEPCIDGLPDNMLDMLAWREFSSVEKSDEQNEDFSVRYKIGYGYSYLYIIIESESDSIIHRDRAYQNGDGFHMVIAKPDTSESAAEFYVLRFSPENTTSNKPAGKSQWYYNIKLENKQLSSSTRFVCKSKNGRCYFELLLPWADVYPYNPLYTDDIGINLCFVKAIGTKDKNYYFIEYDKKIQWEQNKRKYAKSLFEKPADPENSFSDARLSKRNVVAGSDVNLTIRSFAPSASKVLCRISVCSADDYEYITLNKEIEKSAEGRCNEIILPVLHLAPGGYKVIWKSQDGSEGEIPFTVLPEINYEKEKSSLNDLRNTISDGDYYTLLFMIQENVRELNSLKEYEMAGRIREDYNNYINCLEEIKTKPFLFSEKKEVYRRAFLSAVDLTLQPYSIKLPANYDRTKKYPLYVILHGSGTDDQSILKSGSLTENNYIELAPNGRGTSNCFSADNAEIDVKEAIDDVIRNFPVDTTKIIIAGFSMGGYGAYRIFYEYPSLFKGVVIFSGHPNLANSWVGQGHPDFLMSEYLKPFKNIPVYVYHSRNDLNCPFSLTEQVVEKLKKNGAKVTFVISDEGGHGIVNENNLPEYYSWLRMVVDSSPAPIDTDVMD